MNRLSESFSKFFRNTERQRRPGGNAQPQLWQRRGILHFAERLIKNGRSGKDRCLRSCKIVENSARRSIATQNHRNTARNQRREQIAEPVGMRNRNNPEVQVIPANFHGLADLVAVGDDLFATEPNCARRGGCAGSQF